MQRVRFLNEQVVRGNNCIKNKNGGQLMAVRRKESKKMRPTAQELLECFGEQRKLQLGLGQRLDYQRLR
jgi:hypothetical protein